MGTMGFIKSSEMTPPPSSILVEETFTHSIAFGQTGSGKTTSFIYPNLKNRIELGHGILLYDYKGKEHASVKFLANEMGRLDDVVEIGKPWGESINMLENMDEEELDLFFENVLSHGDDSKYWSNSAKSLGQSILEVLGAIDNFSKAMFEIDKDFCNGRYINAGGFFYPVNRTFSSLVKVCNTYENLVKFINNLTDLIRTTKRVMLESARKEIESEEEIELFKPKYSRVVRAHERLKEVIKDTADSLENFGKNSNENLTQNIIGSLTSPLITLAQNRFFNTNSFDIASALNEGKIIIVNAESLSDALLESLNNVILHELSKRTRKIDLNPVSIFIDEAQRVLSEKTDLPVDILREAKVDVFLATQNGALLKERLSSEKYDALIGNLTQKYYFKNSVKEELDEENMLGSLVTFEYMSYDGEFSEVIQSEPIYISKKEKLLIEYKYQKKHKILTDYTYLNRKKSLVLEYVPRMYKDKKLMAINIKTMKEEIVEAQSLEDIVHLQESLDLLFDEIVDDIRREREMYEEYDNELEFDVA